MIYVHTFSTISTYIDYRNTSTNKNNPNMNSIAFESILSSKIKNQNVLYDINVRRENKSLKYVAYFCVTKKRISISFKKKQHK